MRIAVIATTWNDGTMLVQFLRHYAPAVDRVFLLDNESDDGSVGDALSKLPKPERDRVDVSPYSTNEEFDISLKMNAMMSMKSEIQHGFDYILLLDSDEFVIPIQPGTTLRSAIEGRATHSIHATKGWSMVTRPKDAAYVEDVPLLAQRRWGFQDPWYAKPILINPRFDHKYVWGMHGITCDPLHAIGPAFLKLLHFRLFDEDQYARRGLARAARVSNGNRALGCSAHITGKTEADFRREFKAMGSRLDLEKVIS